MGIKLSDFSNRRFLAQEDCDPPILVTIAEMEPEVIVGKDGKEKKKVVVSWVEAGIKPYVSNKTFAIFMAENFGPNPDGWIGKQIVGYKDDSVIMGSERTGGIRFRLPRKKPHSPVKIEQPKSDEEEYEY